MRILTVTNMYPHPGLAHNGLFVEQHVDALRRLGLDVDVFFTNPRRGRHHYFSDIPRLVRTLRRSRYDIAHAHHTYSAFQTVVARRFLHSRVPLVLTLHEGELHADPSVRRAERDPLKRVVYWKGPKRVALELSDAVIAVEARLPAAAGYRGRFNVVPPAIDAARFCPMDQHAARRTLGLPENGAIVFFPANPRRPEKGWNLLENARSFLRAPVHVIAGGSISPDEMPLYMNACDVVVQTSRFEASPMVVKEALACNTPVVSTDVGDVAEVFAHVDGCYCVAANGQAIAAAIEQALYDGPPVQAREWVLAAGLAPETVAARYLEIYDVVASGGNAISEAEVAPSLRLPTEHVRR